MAETRSWQTRRQKTVRLWEDAKGSVITDEQLVRYIAYRGSLSAALEAGDVRLISEMKEERQRSADPSKRSLQRLADYLD